VRPATTANLPSLSTPPRVEDAAVGKNAYAVQAKAYPASSRRYPFSPTFSQTVNPPAKAPARSSLKFGASNLASILLSPTSLQQLAIDTTGVYLPKLPLVRSKAQFFEETYLELIEDLAFYSTIPAAGYLFAKLFKKLFADKSPEISVETIGKSFAGDTAKASRKLLGLKGGVILAALGVALGFEYLIQHTKNIATDKIFHIQNFSAVAGLSQGTKHSQNEFRTSDVDPVEKAKRRIWQTGLFSASLVGLAFALPKLAVKSDAVEKVLRSGLKYLDFGKAKSFDLHKFAMSLIITSGVISYLDASRDSLERKETAFRLAVIVPYLILGKGLVGNGLAEAIERYIKVGQGSERKNIGAHLKQAGLSFKTGENPWKKFTSPGSFFEISTLGDAKEFYEKLGKSSLSKPVQEGIVKWHKALTNKWVSLPLVASALIAGIGINAIAYAQTRRRFTKQRQLEQTARQAQNPSVAIAPPAILKQQQVNPFTP